MALCRNGSSATHPLRPENNVRGVDLVWIEEVSWEDFQSASRQGEVDKSYGGGGRKGATATTRNKSRSLSSGAAVTLVPLPFTCNAEDDSGCVNVLTKLRSLERAAAVLRRRRGHEPDENVNVNNNDDESGCANAGDRNSGPPLAPHGRSGTRSCAFAECDNEPLPSVIGLNGFVVDGSRLPSASAASSASVFRASTQGRGGSDSMSHAPCLDVFRRDGSDDHSESLTLHSHSMSSSSSRASELPGDIRMLYGAPSLSGADQLPFSTAAPQEERQLLQGTTASHTQVSTDEGATPSRPPQPPPLRGTTTTLDRTTISISTSTGLARPTADSRQTLALGPLVAAAAPHYPTLIELPQTTLAIAQEPTTLSKDCTAGDGLAEPVEVSLAPYAAAVQHNWEVAFEPHVRRLRGTVPLYTLENSTHLVEEAGAIRSEAQGVVPSSVTMTYQILDGEMFHVTLRSATGLPSVVATPLGSESNDCSSLCAATATAHVDGIMLDAPTKSSAFATAAGLQAIGCHGVVSVASIRGMTPSDPSFVVVHSTEWALVPLAALMSRLERCPEGLCGPVGQVVIPQLFRLLLRVLTRLVARRFVHGNLAVLENWIVAVPTAASPTATVQHYYILPVHWDASVDLTMLADSRIGVSVPVRVDYHQEATTIAREIGSCLHFFLEVLRWRSFLSTTASSQSLAGQPPLQRLPEALPSAGHSAGTTAAPRSWELLVALRTLMAPADGVDEATSEVSKLSKSPKEILAVLHDAAHAVAAPPSNSEARRFLERLQASPYKELRKKN